MRIRVVARSTVGLFVVLLIAGWPVVACGQDDEGGQAAKETTVPTSSERPTQKSGNDKPTGSKPSSATQPSAPRNGSASGTSPAVGWRTGTVKWFNAEKGYGMITPDDGSSDVYVHHSAIEGRSYPSLNEGERVEFNTEQGARGMEARRVRSL